MLSYIMHGECVCHFRLLFYLALTLDAQAHFRGGFKAVSYTHLIYEMLYNGNPFYDKRFDEHLDMNKQELPDIQTAEYAMEYAKSVRKERYVHISEIESLVGKAQRCILVFMSDDGRKVNNVSLEYDLSNGQILVMEYSNMSNNDEIDLYVTLFMVRDLYVPEEWGAPQVLARLKQALF